MPDRIETIRELLNKDPDDLFLNYSLGMELVKTERWDEALAAFAHCEELDAAYLPAKVEAGKALRSAGRLNDARDAFLRARQAAQTAGDHHVEDYVQTQLDSLPKAE